MASSSLKRMQSFKLTFVCEKHLELFFPDKAALVEHLNQNHFNEHIYDIAKLPDILCGCISCKVGEPVDHSLITNRTEPSFTLLTEYKECSPLQKNCSCGVLNWLYHIKLTYDAKKEENKAEKSVLKRLTHYIVYFSNVVINKHDSDEVCFAETEVTQFYKAINVLLRELHIIILDDERDFRIAKAAVCIIMLNNPYCYTAKLAEWAMKDAIITIWPWIEDIHGHYRTREQRESILVQKKTDEVSSKISTIQSEKEKKVILNIWYAYWDCRPLATFPDMLTDDWERDDCQRISGLFSVMFNENWTCCWALVPKVRSAALFSLSKYPRREYKESAGIDIYPENNPAINANEAGVLKYRTWLAVSPILQFAMKENTYIKLEIPSGLAAEFGVSVIGGVIDKDYEDEIWLALKVFGDIEKFKYSDKFKKGKLAQALVTCFFNSEWPVYGMNERNRSIEGIKDFNDCVKLGVAPVKYMRYEHSA